jgi:hypothetical protein
LDKGLAMSKRIFILALFVLYCCHAVFAQRITESLMYWGGYGPEIQSGLRGDGTTGNYHHLLVGTTAYYYEVMSGGEGMVELWVYDPFKCQSKPDPGYGAPGMGWGLQSTLYQAMVIANDRASGVAGCLGYAPWSTVAPYSHFWFKDGIRGANGVPWQAGWYKWRVNGQMNSITFTLYNVTYCITDGLPDDDLITGDCSQTYDATSNGGIWAAVFCCGWKAMWLRGDNSIGIEDPFVDVTGGTGVFAEFGPVGVARPYQQTSWGNIKSLYR